MGISVGVRQFVQAALVAALVMGASAGARAADPLQEGDIVVSVTESSVTSLYRVDPTGSAAPEALVSNVGNVFAVADSKTIYSVEGTIPNWKVWRTNVVTGVPTLVTDQIQATQTATAVAMEPEGTLLIRGGLFAYDAPGSLVRVNVISGAHSLLASGELFGSDSASYTSPVTLTVDPSGTIYMNGGDFAGLLAVDPDTGAATDVFPSHTMLGVGGVLAMDRITGELIVGDWSPPGLVRIDADDAQEARTPVPGPTAFLFGAWMGVEASGDIVYTRATQNGNEGHRIDRLDSATGAVSSVHQFAQPAHISDLEVVDLPQCDDGIDNDGDALVDLADPGCKNNPNRDSELAPPCSSSIAGINGELVIPALMLLFVFRAFARREARLA